MTATDQEDWPTYPVFQCYCGSSNPGTDGVCRTCDGACYRISYKEHQPGDPHRYRTACVICDEPGYLHVSLEPQTTPKEVPNE